MAAGAVSVGVLEAVIRLRDTMSPAIDNLGKKMRRFGGQMQRAGRQLTASLTLPIAGAAFAAVRAGETIDGAMRTIAVGTGATGAALEGLKESFSAVFREVPQSAATVATVLADLNTVTAATGPTLEHLAVALLDSARVLGEEAAPNALKFARTLEQFAIPAEHGVEVLDMFFATAQRTGAGMGDLIGQAGTFAVVLKNVGFSLDESVALFGELSKGSIEVTRVMPGLNAAFRRWAGEGLDAKAMLVETIEAMRSAASRTESLNIATQAFGAEGASRLNDAVLEGKLNLEAMETAVDGTAGAIAEASEGTETFSEHLATLRNRVSETLAPFGDELKRALEDFMPVVEAIADKLNDWGRAFGALPTPVKNTVLAVGAFLAALGPVRWVIGALSGSIGSLIGIVTSFGGFLFGTATKVGVVSTALTALGSSLTSLGGFLFGTATTVGALSTALAALFTWPGMLAAAFVVLVLKVEPLRALLAATARLIQTVVVVGLKELWGLLQAVGIGIQTGVVVALETVWGWLQAVARGVASFVGALASMIPGAGRLGEAMTGLAGTFDGMTAALRGTSGEAETVEWLHMSGEVDKLGAAVMPVTAAVAAFGAACDHAADPTAALTRNIQEQAGVLRGIEIGYRSTRQNLEALITTQGVMLGGQRLAAAGFTSFVGPIRAARGELGLMDEAMNPPGGFFSGLQSSLSGFMSGLTGGGGLAGFFENLGGGVVEGFGNILSGGLSSLISAGTQLAVEGLQKLGGMVLKGLGKVWSGIKGLFGRSTEDNIRITGERLGWAIGGGLQSTIAETADAIGHDYTAMLLHLSEITQEQGGVMLAGYQRVARTGRDLFSMVQEGRISVEQAMGALGPVLTELAANFDEAGEAGQLQFTELIQVAAEMGVSVEDLSALVGGTLARDALGTELNRALIDANGNIRDLAGSIRAIPSTIPIRADLDVSLDNFRDELSGAFSEYSGGEYQIPGFARGTRGFEDFGKRGTLAVLHGREAVVPAGSAVPGTDALAREIAALRRDLATDRAFQSTLMPKMLAAAMQQGGAVV